VLLVTQDVNRRASPLIEHIDNAVIAPTYDNPSVLRESNPFGKFTSWRAGRKITLPIPVVELIQIEAIRNAVDNKLISAIADCGTTTVPGDEILFERRLVSTHIIPSISIVEIILPLSPLNVCL
jgi:hypothetical protein